MKLTVEQLELLKKDLERKEQQLSQLEKNSSNVYYKRLRLKEEIRNLMAELTMATTLDMRTEEVIDLGSRFRATIDFNGSLDTTDYLISDSNLKVPGFMAISTRSPLAQAVMGLKVQDKFKYDVIGHVYNGIIDEIYKENVIENPKTIKLEK